MFNKAYNKTYCCEIIIALYMYMQGLFFPLSLLVLAVCFFFSGGLRIMVDFALPVAAIFLEVDCEQCNSSMAICHTFF